MREYTQTHKSFPERNQIMPCLFSRPSNVFPTLFSPPTPSPQVNWIFSMVYEAFMRSPFPCAHLILLLFLTPIAGITLPPLLTVLQTTKHVLTSGPLHLQFLLPAVLFLESKACFLTSFKSLLKCHFIIRISLTNY